MKVALLTIGTEITTGQIINSNAAYLANEFVNLGYDPIIHLSVPDSEAEIMSALGYCAERCSYIVTTGGLGPTSDDFTRDVVAKFCRQRLCYDEASWQRIVKRMEGFGIKAALSNKQQCYFPEGAKILTNMAGTANGFICQHPQTCLICLPGPPREIKSLFHKTGELLPFLAKSGGGKEPLKLLRWHALGKSEAELGELVEAAIAGSSLTSGYRPHLPYVEIKIWSKAAELEENQPYVDRLDRILQPWTIVKDDQDICRMLLEKCAHFDRVVICDEVTQGHFENRLREGMLKLKDQKINLEVQSFYHGAVASPSSKKWGDLGEKSSIYGVIGPQVDERHWQVQWNIASRNYEKKLMAPYTKAGNRSRLFAYLSEVTLIDLYRTLESCT